MKVIKTILVLILLIGITSCAPAGPTEHEYGFFAGFWHSLLLPVSSIGSLLSSEIGVYAETNNGFWYYSGCAVELLIFCAVVFRR